MIVKLFQFLQPYIDIGQMFPQFAVTPVPPPQSEAVRRTDDKELLSQTQGTEERRDEEKKDEVTQKEAPDEMETVEEALAIVEVPGERRLEVEPEKDVAREATETRTEGAEEAPEQADPGKTEEGGTRRRRYHKIVVELSDEEENKEEGTQIPLTKRPRTYKQTHPWVVTSMREVSPQVESPQPPPREQRKGKMPGKTPVKEVKEVPGRELRPLTLGRNRVLRDEDEAEAQGSGRMHTTEEGGKERAQEEEKGPTYQKISIEVNEQRLERCTEFEDSKVADECAGRMARDRIMKSKRALDQGSLADVRAEQEFVQYITGIGFEWLLEIEKAEEPVVLAQEFFTKFRFQHTAGVLSKASSSGCLGRNYG